MIFPIYWASWKWGSFVKRELENISALLAPVGHGKTSRLETSLEMGQFFYVIQVCSQKPPIARRKESGRYSSRSTTTGSSFVARRAGQDPTSDGEGGRIHGMFSIKELLS
jgi:hypothetical protein